MPAIQQQNFTAQQAYSALNQNAHVNTIKIEA